MLGDTIKRSSISFLSVCECHPVLYKHSRDESEHKCIFVSAAQKCVFIDEQTRSDLFTVKNKIHSRLSDESQGAISVSQ